MVYIYICIHLAKKLLVNVGKYTIHGYHKKKHPKRPPEKDPCDGFDVSMAGGHFSADWAKKQSFFVQTTNLYQHGRLHGIVETKIAKESTHITFKN